MLRSIKQLYGDELELIDEGVQEAEHDQMLQAARAIEKKDQRGD